MVATAIITLLPRCCGKKPHFLFAEPIIGLVKLVKSLLCLFVSFRVCCCVCFIFVHAAFVRIKLMMMMPRVGSGAV